MNYSFVKKERNQLQQVVTKQNFPLQANEDHTEVMQ